MVGGDFQANVGGLDHYRRFGYKGALYDIRGDIVCAFADTLPSTGRLASPEAVAADACSPDWVTVRYRRNRGILHDGDYPHQSSPVTSISGCGRDGAPLQRVILGFNCFPAGLAECCGRAPEHSAAFNRTIRLYQAMARAGTPITAATVSAGAVGDKYGGAAEENAAATVNGCSSPSSPSPQQQPSAGGEKAKGVSVADLQANPALARMLVLAARKVRSAQVVGAAT